MLSGLLYLGILNLELSLLIISHFGQLAIIFLWTSGNLFHVAWQGKTFPRTGRRNFARGGKIAEGRSAETHTNRHEREAAAEGRGPAGEGTSGRECGRMEGHPDAGAGACRLALPGLWRAAPPRCPSCGQALARGLRLRPRSARGALPVVSRPDGCAVCYAAEVEREVDANAALTSEVLGQRYPLVRVVRAG